MIEPKARETCLATFEVVVEIDEDGRHSLAIPGDFLAERLRIEKVAVQNKFLSDVVMQHLRHLETAQRRSELVSDTVPDQLGYHVRIGKIERSRLIGAAGVNACRIIIDPRPLESWRSLGDQPIAFCGTGESGHSMNDRARRQEAARGRRSTYSLSDADL